jgi:hypothetical protein
MASIDLFRQLALSFPETVEVPHFHRAAFKAKKIFATLDESKGHVTIMLQPGDQAAFCGIDSRVIYPVPGKWGLAGATCFELKGTDRETLLDALTCAYIEKTSKKLAAPFIAARKKIAAA